MMLVESDQVAELAARRRRAIVRGTARARLDLAADTQAWQRLAEWLQDTGRLPGATGGASR